MVNDVKEIQLALSLWGEDSSVFNICFTATSLTYISGFASLASRRKTSKGEEL